MQSLDGNVKSSLFGAVKLPKEHKEQIPNEPQPSTSKEKVAPNKRTNAKNNPTKITNKSSSTKSRRRALTPDKDITAHESLSSSSDNESNKENKPEIKMNPKSGEDNVMSSDLYSDASEKGFITILLI